jgi:hypothetical protein
MPLFYKNNIISLPKYYKLRTCQKGDEAAWVEIINASFNIDKNIIYNIEKGRKEILE